jgi:hypothetical protein
MALLIKHRMGVEIYECESRALTAGLADPFAGKIMVCGVE